jgi:hypothetical protein
MLILLVVAIILSVVVIGVMLRPYERSCDYDFGAVFRLFWLIPLLGIWLAFFAILAWQYAWSAVK